LTAVTEPAPGLPAAAETPRLTPLEAGAAFFSPLRSPASHASLYLWTRFLFLRALGLVFLSAFYSLAFQIHGLLGPRGILPAGTYLAAVARVYPATRLWYAPTLLWLSTGDPALTALVALGIVASCALILNLWPRASLAVAALCFLSFVAAARDFSSYQSDGMLLEAGFLSLFFAPPGLRPGLGAAHPPSPASLWLLRWEWFRIYFESGLVKLLSGEPQWRDLSAMDKYYETGPLPTWLGWYAHQLPHGFHAATALLTLVVELGAVWLAFLPRRFRGVRWGLFAVVTLLQVGIILTANYAFLNYLVLILGLLLLDDRMYGVMLERLLPHRPERPEPASAATPGRFRRARLAASALALSWVFYATLVTFPFRVVPDVFLAPAEALEPFRIANSYGLFAVMTRGRYEVEFQGTRDGTTWLPYPFRYKPQDVTQAPGIYAPYQPRFEWNLWFASLSDWRGAPWVVAAEARLLDAEPAVLALFREDPFHGARPLAVRTVLWQYWFTSREERARTGAWWRREERGPYAPGVRRDGTGKIALDEGAVP
jgi:lipase maturation factor 1